MNDTQTIEQIKKAAIESQGTKNYFNELLSAIGDAQIVLLGEATHGTHEFYELRAEICKRLIQEKGFHALAIEGDFPDAYQVNRYIQNLDNETIDPLIAFDRFPSWMWRNAPMSSFVRWLRDYNRDLTNKIGFYGLDLYSLYRSIDVVINCLSKIDHNAENEARYYYSCFDQFDRDPQLYGSSVHYNLIKSCEYQVIEQLKRLQQNTWEYIAHTKITPDQAFYLEQNARVVKSAEHYYRSLFVSEVSNWNIRDSHMFETLQHIIEHYKNKGIQNPKIIIWAHNSHIGNAQATQMGAQGEHNIGQLSKEHYKKKAFTLGFTTYNGTVSAASDWHGPVERKTIRDALPKSYEALFHATGIGHFLIKCNQITLPPLLERAIGVIYRPQTERASHYFRALLTEQFDAIIHYDTTTAVEPIEKTSQWLAGEVPETYPSGY